jgi:hypothetical protein
MKVTEGVRCTQNQDGGIVLDTRRGQMFRLNLVGSRILALVEAGKDEPRIVEEISREFGAERETANVDVHEFIDALEKHHLIERRNSGVST